MKIRTEVKVVEIMTKEKARSFTTWMNKPCLVKRKASWLVDASDRYFSTYDRAVTVSVEFAVTCPSIMELDELHILDYPQKPNDDRLWLDYDECKSIDPNSNFAKLKCKIYNFNRNAWSSESLPSYINATESKASAYVFAKVQSNIIETDLVVFPGINPLMLEQVGVNGHFKLCKIEDVLPTSLIRLIKTNPCNASVRLMVRSKILAKIPDEIVIPESIIEWIESNVQALTEVSKPKIDTSPRVAPSASLRVSLECTEVEYGRVNYSVSNSASTTQELTDLDIVDIAREVIENDEDMESVYTNVFALCHERTSENPPNMDHDGDMDYNDYEPTETEYFESTIAGTEKNRVKAEIRSILGRTLTAEELENLGI